MEKMSIYMDIYLYIYIYTHRVFSVHSSVVGHVGCSHVLATVNCAPLNFGVHASFRIIVLSGFIPRSGAAGSYGNCSFSSLKTFHTVPYLMSVKFLN